MNAYRLSGTIAKDRTITVRVPEGALVGAEAEVIVLITEAAPILQGEHPLRAFLDEMRRRPVDSDGARRAKKDQAFLRGLREEWD